MIARGWSRTGSNSFNLPRLLVALLMLGTACLAGCKTQPTEAQLDTWRQETIARNAAALEARAGQSKERSWNLMIQGQTGTGKAVNLNWEQIRSLATTHVLTKEPHHTKDLDTVLDFRGVPISQLLATVGVASNVTEVTFVAFDAFRSTVQLADLQRYPIILAIERNKQLLPRTEGGPIYLVFPHTQYPQLQAQYDNRFWLFYTTHIIVGTESVRVRVGNREFDGATLDRLPQTTVTETVGYKIGWPNSKVKLKGVRVRDVLAAAGISLSGNNRIVIRGKAAIHQDSAKDISLSAKDVQNCDILLATRWGENLQPIPARLGGPVTLAFPSACQRQTTAQYWVTFVEELQVTTP